jgi:hypothetical protein
MSGPIGHPGLTIAKMKEENESLRGQLADAEQAIKIACEQQDASERDTFTAITAREEAEMERDELREIYKHTHKGPGDPCGKCGLDIRDEIHVRLAAEQEEGKR